jgi:hypothetical protein
MSDGTEVPYAISLLVAALKAGVSGPAVSQRVVYGTVPQDMPFPVILVQLRSGKGTRYQTGEVALKYPEFSVRAVFEGQDIGPGVPIMAAIQTDLQNQITRTESSAAKITWVEDTMMTTDTSGVTYNYAGAVYRVTVCQT